MAYFNEITKIQKRKQTFKNKQLLCLENVLRNKQIKIFYLWKIRILEKYIFPKSMYDLKHNSFQFLRLLFQSF